MKRALAVLAAFAAVLVLPSVASAAYTSTITPGVVTGITLTGDGGSDNLVIDDNGTNLTHNRAADPGFNSATDFVSGNGATDDVVPANDGAILLLNAGGGDDALTVLTNGVAGGSQLDGQDGNDTLSGTDASDDLFGGQGDDRLIGFRGADDHFGGDGNDTLVWNNGDGSDVMEGQNGGGDVVEFNGNPIGVDTMQLAPSATPGRFLFTRTQGSITLDIGTSERMSANGLAGSDDIRGTAGLAGGMLLEVDGGPGTDTIVGGDGPDLLRGGDDVDLLSGSGGADRLVGDRANDTMGGGPGDDTLVWNNGDGTDGMDGGSGDADRIEVNGNPNAGETFTLNPQGGGARFDRTSQPGAFGLNITGSERLELNALGGNDAFTVGNGVPLATTFAGAAGDDQFTGGDGDETFLGGSGNDTGTGNGGRDVLDGGPDDDSLLARDGLADLVRCGDGSDTAQSDLVTLDVLVACETVDAVAPAPAGDAGAGAGAGAQPQVVDPQLGDRIAERIRFRTRNATLARNRRSFVVRLECPEDEAGGCDVDLDVITRSVVRVGSLRIRMLLAQIDRELEAGESERVRVRLPAGIGRLFRGRRSLAVRLVGDTTDSAGNSTDLSANLTLRLPRSRR